MTVFTDDSTYPAIFPKSGRVLLPTHIRPLLLNETNGERQPTFAAPATRIHLPISTAPHHLSSGAETGTFLACFSVLPTDVDRWGSPSDDTDARLRFGVGCPMGGSRWRGEGIGRGSRCCSTSTANSVENVWTNLG